MFLSNSTVSWGFSLRVRHHIPRPLVEGDRLEVHFFSVAVGVPRVAGPDVKGRHYVPRVSGGPLGHLYPVLYFRFLCAHIHLKKIRV